MKYMCRKMLAILVAVAMCMGFVNVKAQAADTVISRIDVEIAVPTPGERLATECDIINGMEGIESYRIEWWMYADNTNYAGELAEYDEPYWLFIYLKAKDGYKFAPTSGGEATINNTPTAGWWWHEEDQELCININQFKWTSPEPPKSDLESGTYAEDKEISLSVSKELEEIYYTTDGSEPTLKSTRYTGPISVTGEEGKSTTTVIKAITNRQYVNVISDVSTFTYTIDKSGKTPVAQHTIKTSAGEGGSILPSGVITVNDGDDSVFYISADEGYTIDTILVDGEAAPNQSEYIFNNVTSNHTISVTFKKKDSADPIGYNIIEGAESTWSADSEDGLTIIGDGDFSKFVGVNVDGELLDPESYTVESGSTVVTLHAEYLATLSEGTHTFEIVWDDGSAETTFNISNDAEPDDPVVTTEEITTTEATTEATTTEVSTTQTSTEDESTTVAASEDGSTTEAGSTTASNQTSPKTGDTSDVVLGFVLLIMSAAGIMVLGRKKSNKREK